MIKLRRTNITDFDMKFIGNTDLTLNDHSIIHHDPSAISM